MQIMFTLFIMQRQSSVPTNEEFFLILKAAELGHVWPKSKENDLADFVLIVMIS